MQLPGQEEETPSHRFTDLFNQRYFSSDSEGSPRVVKKSHVEGRDSRRPSLLPKTKSFRIIEREGNSARASARRIRLPSAGLTGDIKHGKTRSELKSTTAREQGAEIGKSHRLLGLLGMSARSVAESVDLTKLRNPPAPSHPPQDYIRIFEDRFKGLLHQLQARVQLRLESRQIKQTVNRRFDKKTKLLREKQEEKKIKIYGTKVRAMNKNNFLLLDGALDRPPERKML